MLTELKKMMLFDADGGGNGGAAGDPPPNNDDPPAGGGDSGQGDPGGNGNGQSFEDWLAEQPEDVQKMYKEHTSGLKSALDKERAANKGVAEKLKRLADLEAAEKKRKEAEMSELDKAKAKLAEAEQKLAQQTKEMNTFRIKHAVEITAGKLGFQNPEDAYQLADLSAVEITDEGKVAGVEEALKALAKSRPYLLKASTTTHPNIDANTRGAGGRGELTEERKAELNQRYRIIG